jgi:hypothetical protein
VLLLLLPRQQVLLLLLLLPRLALLLGPLPRLALLLVLLPRLALLLALLPRLALLLPRSVLRPLRLRHQRRGLPLQLTRPRVSSVSRPRPLQCRVW